MGSESRMTDDQEHLARLEAEVKELEVRSKRLGDETSAAREDWERKRNDDSVPGAPPPEPQADSVEAREPWPDE